VVTPSVLDFGVVAVGSSSDLTVTVMNTGASRLDGRIIAPTGFSVVGSGAYSLEAGQSSTVTIRFSPATSGLIAGNAAFLGANGAVVAFSGRGDLAPVISVTPISLDFGGVEVGTASDLPVVLKNTGGGTATGTLVP